MTQFTFRLQPLLKLRETERDRCREQLAAAYQAEQILMTRRQAVVDEIDETKAAALNEAQPGTLQINRLLNTHRYELVLTSQLQQIDRQRTQVVEEIERRRQTLVQADRELRILQKLRERQSAAHRTEEDKQETRLLDEIALQRRRAATGGLQS